ncbi:MAG: ribosome biogenesis GTPase Der [Deltaproteobacteria bacterium]|nr:ribosome biogenesis GTPase Der [Deltaproteobacteria bacterium]
MSRSRPLIAFVGRPNVGKSTLFNRVVRRRAAIVQDVPGVTRDRNYGDFTWEGRLLSAVDTGGFEPVPKARKGHADDRSLMRSVQEQAQLAVDEAAVVVLVVDGRDGLTEVDRAVADLLRRSGTPLFVAVNKMDTSRTEEGAPLAEFYDLGFGVVQPVSAEHGRGCGELVDAIIEALDARGTPPPHQEAEPEFEVEAEEEPEEEARHDAVDLDGEIRLAIVGRPNVGKSTLVNAILREERFVVSEVAGTTRDSIDTAFEHEGQKFVITDTAGIRRKRSIAQKVEKYSVIRAMRSIDDADVVAVILDAQEAGADQDARLIGLVIEKGRALVLVVNKWDVAQQAGATQRWYRDELAKRLPFVPWAPILFVTARDGRGVDALLREAGRLARQYRTRLPTPKLNTLLEAIQVQHPAPLSHGHPVKLYYVSMVSTAPPTFVLQASRPETIPDSYKRFIENRFRETFSLKVPLRFVYRERARRQRSRRAKPKRRGA